MNKIGDVKPLTEEEYMLLAKFEARLRHPTKGGLNLANFDIAAARTIYKRFKFL